MAVFSCWIWIFCLVVRLLGLVFHVYIVLILCIYILCIHIMYIDVCIHIYRTDVLVYIDQSHR